MTDKQVENIQCPVCGYYCLGKGGLGCIDKPGMIDAQEKTRSLLKETFGNKSFRAVIRDNQTMLNAAPTPPNDLVEKLWIWKNGDHYLAYKHEYPCIEQGGDPLTAGEPIGYALLKPSFGRESIAPTPPNTVDKAAYDGAREDLAIWKKRALEAENKVKIYDQRIVDIGAIAMSPVKVKQPPNTITITADEYERLKKDAERLEHVDDLLYQIESWCKAYPLDDFTTRPY